MGIEYDTGSGLATVPGVEIFSTGRHQKVVWTPEKLKQAVHNFDTYQLPGKVDKAPPVVLGHSEAQKLMHESGYPRVGSPTAMRYHEEDCRLCKATGKAPAGVEAFDEHGSCPICLGSGKQGIVTADLGAMPVEVAQLIKGRAYTGVSAEIAEERPAQVPGQGASFRRITLQGDRLPHIKTLRDMPASYERLAEMVTPDTVLRPLWCELTSDGAAWECFSEVLPMAEAFSEGHKGTDWAKKLLAYGHTPRTLEKMDEGAMAETCAIHDKMAAPKYEHGDKPDEEWAAHEPKEEAIEKYGEMMHKHMEHHAARGKKLFGAGFHVNKSHQSALMHHSHSEAEMFTEADRKAIVAAVVAEIRAEVEPLKKDVTDFKTHTRAAGKRSRVEAFVEQMKAKRKVYAHEMDETAAKDNPRFRTMPERLMMYDDTAIVEKFTEGGKEVAMTQLDLEMAAIESRPPQRYGELSRAGKGGAAVVADGQDIEKAKVELHYESFAETFKKLNTSKEEFVGAFLNNRKYDETITAEKFLNPVAGK